MPEAPCTSAHVGEHPEAWCRRCGGANCVWHAPNALWNAVLGTVDNPRAEGVILCPTCFTASVDAHLTALRARVAELEAAREAMLTVCTDADPHDRTYPYVCLAESGNPIIEAATLADAIRQLARWGDAGYAKAAKAEAALATARADMQERYAKACESFAEITRTPEGAIGAIGAYACAIIIRSLSPSPEPPHA